MRRAKGKLGEIWEKRILKDSRSKGYTCVRIPNAIHGAYSNKGKVWQEKTPFDYCVGIEGKAIFFDAKYTEDNSLNIKSKITPPKKIHQYWALMDAHNHGNMAGYLIYFNKHNLITWVCIERLDEIIEIDKLKSLNPDIEGLTSQSAFDTLDLKVLCFNEDLGMEVKAPRPDQ